MPLEKPYTLYVCTDSKCAKNKGGKVCSRLRDLVEELSLRDQVRIKETGCLGKCKKGPNVLVCPGKELVSEVRPKEVAIILERLDILEPVC